MKKIKSKELYEQFLLETNAARKNVKAELDEINRLIKLEKEKINTVKDSIRVTFDIHLENYKEWAEETTADNNNFNQAIINAIVRSKGKYKISDLKRLLKYIKLIRIKKDILIRLSAVNRRMTLSYKEYMEIVKKYYNYGVHKTLIKGYGYDMQGGLGYFSINRWKLNSENLKRKAIDYKLTNIAKRELIEKGQRPYDAKEAEIYKIRGLKYDGVPYIVYKSQTVELEIDYVHSRYKRSFIEFIPVNLKNYELGEISYNAKAEILKNDEERLFKMVDAIRTKLNVYLILHPDRYINYIRNGSQNKRKYRTISRKNRQRFQLRQL